MKKDLNLGSTAEAFDFINNNFGEVKYEDLLDVVRKEDHHPPYDGTAIKEIVDLLKELNKIVIRSGEQNDSLRIFPVDASWFRCTRYLIREYEDSKGQYDYAFIEPAPRARLIHFGLEDVLDNVVLRLSEPPTELLKKDRPKRDWGKPVNRWEAFERYGEEYALSFAKDFGLLGEGFYHVKFKVGGSGSINIARLFRMAHNQTIDEHFASSLVRPVHEECRKKNSLDPLRHNYRESFLAFLEEAEQFAHLYRMFKLNPTSPSTFLFHIEKYILRRTSARIVVEDQGIRLKWEVSSLIDGVYMRALERELMDNKFEVCKNPVCRKIFFSKDKRFRFCGGQCRNYYNTNKRRGKFQ